MRRTILTLAACWALGANAADADGPAAWKGDFYAKYPVYRSFFPFGVYGGLANRGYTSSNLDYMDDERGYRFQLELLRENYLNLIWGGNFEQNMALREGRYVLDEDGRRKADWAKRLEFRFLPSFCCWFATKKAVGEVFKDLGGKDRWLSEEEIDGFVEKHRPRFEAVQTLRRELGDTMIGLVYDDEPASVVKSCLSAGRALKRFLPDVPLPNVTGPTHHLTAFLPYVELICTESYGRDKWETRDQFLEYYRRSPDTVVWNDVLTGSYAAEPTLPDWPDGKPTAGEMRLAYWQSVAGGAKGFVSYLYRLRPSWWVGDDSFFNVVGRETKNDGLGVMREVGRELVAIGPLLLSTRPVEDDIPRVRFECRTLDDLRSRGPALDCGVLQEREAARRYVVVYNNDVDAAESGVMSLPGEWLDGKGLYDLHALEALVPVAAPASFAVGPLQPGQGRILLLADPTQFAACKDAVLYHRARNELIRLDIRLRELRPIAERHGLPGREAEALIETVARLTNGVAAVRAVLDTPGADVASAAERVGALLTLADGARGHGQLGLANRKLRAIEDAVVRLDDFIESHSWELFGYTPLSRTYYLHVPRNGRLMFEYRDLLVKYFAAKNVYWRGAAGKELLDLLDNYAREAEELTATYRRTIDEALAAQRQPVRVLFVTPERHDLEFIETFAWLYKNFPAAYGFVKADGRIEDRDGEALRLEDFDALWMHAVRAPGPLPDGAVGPEHALRGEWLAPAFMADARAHLEAGRSLLLTGLAAMVVLPLGLEQTPPNVVRSQSPPPIPMLRGFAACPGFGGHPVFRGYDPEAVRVNATNLVTTMGPAKQFAPWPNAYGPYGKGTGLRFDPAGFYTTGEHPKLDHDSECTWHGTNVRGRVVADVYDHALDTLGGYAGIVEYGGQGGMGKVLVVGAAPFDLTPGTSYYPQFHSSWKCFVRGLAYNMLCYLGHAERYARDEEEAAASPSTTRKDLDYLPTTWKFRLDPDEKGEGEQWYGTDLDDSGWQDIHIGATWESQGYDYDGSAWYRTTLTIPERLRGQRVSLVFGAADEQAWVYLDGQLLGHGGGDPHEDGLGWARPFRFDISEQAKAGVPLQLAVRVHDSMAAGGLWKPVYLTAEE